MDEIVAFGELMLSLSPDGFRRIVQADRLNVFYTGAEANVLAGIEALGGKTQLVTRLPENSVGEAALGAMRRYGVGTEHIITGGGRIGVIFNEKGFDARPSAVIYDRKHTAFSELRPGMLDWERILRGAKWFHFGGTAPALGEYLPDVTAEAVETAEKLGIPVSCDLNYRSKLWSRERAGEVMRKLIPEISLIICGEGDADLFGAESGEDLGRFLYENFGVGRTALTRRKVGCCRTCEWRASLYDHETDNTYTSGFTMTMLNRIGGGDAFAAGLIYCLSEGYELSRALDFAAAFCRLKHSVEDDFALISRDEVEALLSGSEVRIKR